MDCGQNCRTTTSRHDFAASRDKPYPEALTIGVDKSTDSDLNLRSRQDGPVPS